MAAAGVATVGVALGGPSPAASAATTRDADPRRPSPSGLTFAVVTDTHADLDVPTRTADLTRVMAHIDSRDPTLVLNCGDITDYGVQDEFALYRSCIPPHLWSRIRHVPGNHEVSWNADVLEAYRATFGPTHYSFDAGGVHFVALDPMVSQESWFYFGEELLGWLARDLRRVRTGMPTVVFNHFPLGNTDNFVADGDDFLRVIRPYPVRVAFAGHIHQWRHSTYNGLTQLVGNAVLNGPFYYWAELRDDGTGPFLRISQVTVPSGGDATETVVADAPLAGRGPGGDLGPFDTTASVSGSSLDVGITAPATGAVHVAWAKIYPQGGPAGSWTKLTDAGGGQWRGRVDIAALPPGQHRVQVRTADGHGVVYDDTARFDIASTSAEVAWARRIHGRIAANLAEHSGLVVAGSTEGVVAAFAVGPDGATERWHTRIGGVYKAPAMIADGTRVLVGSADHHLYALDTRNGRSIWRRDLGAAVQCDVVIVSIDGSQRAVVASGDRLLCVDMDGNVRWAADLGGIFTGAVACDGERVFTGSGSGSALGFDARSGERLWSTECTGKDNDYDRLIYGPWASRLRMLPSGEVLVTSFTTAFALDPRTGAVVWQTDGSLHQVEYTPPLVSDHGVLIFDGKYGSAHLLDAATGAETWTARVLPRTFGSGPIPSGSPGVHWMVGNSDRLIKLDLAAREVTQILQVSTSFTSSTPVLVAGDGGAVLVSGSKDGLIRGITGLERT